MQNSNILNKKQNEFHLILSRFSHEIRNPIALIGSELQLIEDTHPEVSAYDYWNDITANLEYTKELLNNLSDYNNAYKLSPKKTELFPYLQAIISSIHPTYEYLGISLAEQISPALPALYIDRIKLKQALLNLFRNAAEAVPVSDGKVKFCAFSSKKAVHISITDNGCGIPEDQLEQIFTPFVTFKKNGTGLGLSITSQIIQAHGGKIYAENEPDSGASFHMLLPEDFRG